MQSALRKTVMVKHGGLIEFRAPELAEGTTAEVIVIVDTAPSEPPHRLAEIIGKAKGGFTSSDDADEFVRHERNSWHS